MIRQSYQLSNIFIYILHHNHDSLTHYRELYCLSLILRIEEKKKENICPQFECIQTLSRFVFIFIFILILHFCCLIYISLKKGQPKANSINCRFYFIDCNLSIFSLFTFSFIFSAFILFHFERQFHFPDYICLV